MNEQILAILEPARRSRHFRTEKPFRFLFAQGTSALAGADLVFEAFRRGFGADDEAALVVVRRREAEERLDRLARLFEAEGAPEVEYLERPLGDDELAAVLADVDALVHPWTSAPDRELVRLAAAAGLPMILPEDEHALALLGHEAAYLVPRREVALAAGDGRLNRVDPQDLLAVMRRVIAEPEQAHEKALRARRRLEGRAEPVSGLDFPICWSGAALDFSGYAKTSRTLLPALLERGVDLSFHAFMPEARFLESLAARPESLRAWRHILERQPRGGLQVVFHPPFRQGAVSFMGHMRAGNPDFAAQVAFTMFETDRLPQGWADQLNLMDEVWVPTEFNVETFARSGVEPAKLKVVPLAVDPAPFAGPIAPYDVPGRKGFNFLSVFDWTLRKGWDVLLEAFLRSFSAADDVSLTIRAYAAIADQAPIPEQIEAKARALGIDPEEAPTIILIDEFVGDEDMPALYAAADAFVLPTRGEGWGMPLIEAMAAGLPTIATRWSGNLAFMTDDNSWLIDVPELGPIDPEQTRVNPFYEADHRWAEPDPGHLGAIMRAIVADPEAARRKAERGRGEVVARFSADRVAAILCERAADLMARVRVREERAARAPAELAAPPNIAWTGPVYDRSGYADEGRNFVLGLLDQEVPLRQFPVLWQEEHAAMDPAAKRRLQAAETGELVPGRPVVMIQHALGLVVEPHPRADLSIARTMFETDSLPADWVAALRRMDAVFVPSEFNRETFIRAGLPEETIEVVPEPIDADLFRREPRPFDLGTDRAFKFLSVFDWTRRKGWDVLLRAYLEEFAADEDVCLVLKVWSSLGKSTQGIAAEIESFVRDELGLDPARCADITILDRHVATDQMLDLHAAADCYVQPSRGEGWGRPIMEAMAAGRPAVATAWGGNTAFMNRRNSCLIEYAMRPCGPEAVREAAWFAGQNWAEPYVPHLRHVMRTLFAKPEIRASLGAQARRDVLALYDRKRVAGLLLAAVERMLARRGAAKASAPSRR